MLCNHCFAMSCAREPCTTSRSPSRSPSLRSPRAYRPSSRRVSRSAHVAWPRRMRSCAVCRPSRLSAVRRWSALTRRERSPPTRCLCAGWVSWRPSTRLSVLALRKHIVNYKYIYIYIFLHERTFILSSFFVKRNCTVASIGFYGAI